MQKKYFYWIISSVLLLMACNNNSKNIEAEVVVAPDSPVKKFQEPTATIPEDSVLKKLTKEIFLVLKNKEYKKFSGYFHPTEGCLFSPYAYIDTAFGPQLTTEKFNTLLLQHKKIVWGSYDGSGDDILLTVPQYLETFVYNADYLSPEKFSFNEIIGVGNSINNIKQVFPNLVFTESYFSGFNKAFEGMDWTSLRLVFKKQDSTYYLRAVVHDAWTI